MALTAEQWFPIWFGMMDGVENAPIETFHKILNR